MLTADLRSFEQVKQWAKRGTRHRLPVGGQAQATGKPSAAGARERNPLIAHVGGTGLRVVPGSRADRVRHPTSILRSLGLDSRAPTLEEQIVHGPERGLFVSAARAGS